MHVLLKSLVTSSLFAAAMAAGQTTADARAAHVGEDSLRSGFEHPPADAMPRVWWHWMNGNITQDGIRLDLEWMRRIGIAGFQIFDAALETPQVVPHRIAYMTPEWKDAFRYATSLADRYGMEETIAGSPGWSESGGPWVPPSQGMKKYVWSETAIEGGQPFSGTLAQPPSNTGPFQNIGAHGAEANTQPQFYADSAVVAYRRPAGDIPLASLHPMMSTSNGALDYAALTDGDLDKSVQIPFPAAGQKAWLQYEFAEATPIRAVTIVSRDPNRGITMATGIAAPEKSLEASDDGQTWREVVPLPGGDGRQRTISFSPVRAKYFRVTFLRAASQVQREALPRPSNSAPQPALPATLRGYEVPELILHPGLRVHHFEEKAAFTPEPDLYGFATVSATAGQAADNVEDQAIEKSEVIDLTSKMQRDGTLNWTPPPGHWVVLRFGYSLLGITNHPATAEATGLEVDKLDHRYVRNYMEKYLDSYQQTVGAGMMGQRGIRYVINDSWEAGTQNWTDAMVEQFRKRRGYDPIPWMPVLTGKIVESPQASDQFLWDFRKTIADLTADEHYGELESVLHERHMGHYGESHEGGRVFIADGMEVKKFNEVPMSAMWTQSPGVNAETYNFNADDRESASVAHIYGQNLAAAESMTAKVAPWAYSPATLKPTADQEFLNGINRICIHESAHQPLVDKKPGLTLGKYGQWFSRNETWAEQAGPWISYLGRTSFLLQQGHFGADLIYFYGEDSNLTALFRYKSPNVPDGYGFDYVNADALIHALKVVNGRITTPGGTTYRLLGLDPYSVHMSLPVLRAMHHLVIQGATVAGPKPIDDPSLADDHAEFRQLDDELFGDGTGIHHVGKGVVYAGQTPAQALTAMQVSPDFDYDRSEGETRLRFVHRRLADGDIYFVDNRSDRGVQVDAKFRVAGKAPEFWYAETGRSEPASFSIADGRTTVPLKLDAWGTVFVVFRKPAHATSHTVPAPLQTELATIPGPWNVSFPPNWGAPPSIVLDTLSSWPDNQVAGVKYFSGTGTYTRTIQAPSAWFRDGAHLWLDLGEVKNLAEVEVNGKSLGILWHAPYRVDATAALRPGANELVIKVTNAWVNRLIGDQQQGATQYTFADVKPYRADSPLQPSGLLGPVRVEAATMPKKIASS